MIGLDMDAWYYPAVMTCLVLWGGAVLCWALPKLGVDLAGRDQALGREAVDADEGAADLVEDLDRAVAQH